MHPTGSKAIWLDWVGLPHEVGADPRAGKGACCLVMARLLLTEAGRYFPPIEDKLLALVRQSAWQSLTKKFAEYTEPLSDPEPWALTLIKNGPHGLGVGTVVPDGYLLLPHHRRGVTAVPMSVLRPLTFHRVRTPE